MLGEVITNSEGIYMNDETLGRPLMREDYTFTIIQLPICSCKPSKHLIDVKWVCGQCGGAIMSKDELQRNPKLKKYL